MDEEDAVGDAVDLDSGLGADRLDDPLEMDRVLGQHGNVAHLRVALDADEVDGVERAARLADRRRQLGERTRPVLELDADDGAERGGGVGGCHGS